MIGFCFLNSFFNFTNWKLLIKIFYCHNIIPGSSPVVPELTLKKSPLISTPLRSIFNDDHVEKIPNSWRSTMMCLRCRTLWPEVHATRMIAHLLQWPGMHMTPCLGKNDEDAKKNYQDLFDRRNSHEVGKKQVREDSAELVQDS